MVATKTRLGKEAKKKVTKIVQVKKPRVQSPLEALRQQQIAERAATGKPFKSKRPRVRVGGKRDLETGRENRTQEWMDVFIPSLRATHNIQRACEAAGIARGTAKQHKASDPAFKERWIEAWETGIDQLEEEAHKRAMAGSDILLMFMLNGNRSGKYREKKGGNTNIVMPGAFTLNIKAAGENEETNTEPLALPSGDSNIIDVPEEDITHINSEEQNESEYEDT